MTAENQFKTEQTSQGLRETLFKVMDDVIGGKIETPRAHAIGKLAAQIIATVQIEVEFHKHVTKFLGPDESTTRTVLRLGQRIPGENDDADA